MFSTPYCSTGYVLVTRKGQKPATVKKLEDIKTETFGAEAGSIAADLLKQKGDNRRVYRSQVAVLNALQKGQIRYGILWANALWLIEKGSPSIRRSASVTESAYPNLKLVEGYVPESGFRWNVAIAVRKGDEDLRKAIESVIKEKLTSNRIEKICRKYHLPHYPPSDQEVVGRKSNAKIQN